MIGGDTCDGSVSSLHCSFGLLINLFIVLFFFWCEKILNLYYYYQLYGCVFFPLEL